MKGFTAIGLIKRVFDRTETTEEKQEELKQWFTFFMTENDENRPNSIRLPSEKRGNQKKESKLARRLKKEAKQLKLFMVSSFKRLAYKCIIAVETQKQKLEQLLFSNAVEFENSTKQS